MEAGKTASTAATTVTTTDASGVLAVEAQGTPPTAAAASAQTVANAGSETPARTLVQADKAEANPDDSVSAAEEGIQSVIVHTGKKTSAKHSTS